MAFSKTYDEDSPVNHTTFASQPSHVRDTRTMLRERLQFGGMYFPATHDELAGEHTYIRMANTTAPAAVTGKWHLYVDADGLHIVDPSGTETDLTGDSVQAQTGDWMLSTVTTARTGWTNVSSTYANKFIRISTAGLSTGGADTHTHSAGSFAGPSHTHTVARSGWGLVETGGVTGYLQTSKSDNSAYSNLIAANGISTGSEGTGAITGTSASGTTVPAYVTVVIFQKD